MQEIIVLEIFYNYEIWQQKSIYTDDIAFMGSQFWTENILETISNAS